MVFGHVQGIPSPHGRDAAFRLPRPWDSRDDRWETEERWRHTTLHEAGESLPLALGSHEVTLRVPTDALPSSPHVVEWKVEAKIDRRRGMDERAEAVLLVRAPAPATPPAAGGPFETGEGGVAIAELPAAVRVGEELAGVVAVTPDELPGGQATRIPFAIRVPDAGPTVVAPHGTVEWQLLASVTRRMRRDLDASAVVVVS